MIAVLLAMTLVSTVPPEPDTDHLCLLIDGEVEECFFVEAALSKCMVFHSSLSGVFTVRAWDKTGNVSLPSNPLYLNAGQAGDLNFDGDVDVLDVTIARRRLAGLEP